MDVTADRRQVRELFGSFEPGGGARLERYLVRARYKDDVAMMDFLYREYASVSDILNLRMLVEGDGLRAQGQALPRADPCFGAGQHGGSLGVRRR